MTLKVFNTGKGLHHFLMALKVFNIEKRLHHFETLKDFNCRKRLHHILMTLKVCKNSYSVECWWAATSEGRISYIWLTNLTSSECQISKQWEYISCLGSNLPRMRGLTLVLMSNVCYMAIILIFFVVPWWLLLVAGGYCSSPLVTACSHF